MEASWLTPHPLPLHPHPRSQRRQKTVPLAGKVMASIFLDADVILIVD